MRNVKCENINNIALSMMFALWAVIMPFNALFATTDSATKNAQQITQQNTQQNLESAFKSSLQDSNASFARLALRQPYNDLETG